MPGAVHHAAGPLSHAADDRTAGPPGSAVAAAFADAVESGRLDLPLPGGGRTRNAGRSWRTWPPHAPAAFAARYESGDRPHPHVHGANIGIRASACRAAGGFRPLRTAEDHALLAAVAEAGCSALKAGDIAVETSGRRHARAPHGFSHLLRTLAPTPQDQLPALVGVSGHPRASGGSKGARP